MKHKINNKYIILIISIPLLVILWACRYYIYLITQNNLIVSASIILAFATVVLAYWTFVLARYTNDINEREKKNKRDNELRECILLVNQISPPFDCNITLEHKTQISKLVVLKKYIHSPNTKEKLNEYYNYLNINYKTNALWNPMQWWDENNFTDIIHDELVKWHNDLGN
jgi:hypothetical protein